MKVVIQPCSDKISAANLEKTIFKSVASKKILEFIPDHNEEQFARSFPNQANLWGVTNGSNNRSLKKWEKIQDGDKILLYRNKKLFLSGTIGFKIKLKNLARELWGAKDDGSTWENIYFIKNIREEDIAIEDFNRELGYDEANIIQGFNVLDENKSLRLLSNLLSDIPEGPYPAFTPGQAYIRREEIHAPYGGQQQGGISTPKNTPAIFIFTGDHGHQYGYKDGYDEDGLFRYTGEGTSGDMSMTHGNLQIRDHKINGKRLYLFEDQSPKGRARNYVGEFRYINHLEEYRPDSSGQTRKVFTFLLEKLFRKGFGTASKSKGEKAESPKRYKSTTTVFNRREETKNYALSRAEGKCESCMEAAPFHSKKGPFLEVHHVNELSDNGPDTPDNVIALCPNCHRRAHYSADKNQFNQSLRRWLDANWEKT